MQDRHDTKETIKFIKLFDRAFDCLNVTRIKMSDKPDRQAFRSPNDPRFEVQFLTVSNLGNVKMALRFNLTEYLKWMSLT